MKRLLSTTTALALALAPLPTVPARAQTMAADGSVIAEDGTVLCTPTADQPCDLKAIRKAQKKAEAKAKKAAEKAQAEAGAAETNADPNAAPGTDPTAAAPDATDTQAAEAAAQAEADARAAEQQAAEAAAAEAERQAAEQQAAEAAAQAEAERQAAEAAAAQKAAEEAAAAEQQAAEAAAQAEAERQAAEAAAAQKAADEAAAAQAEVQSGGQQDSTAEAQPAPGMMPDQTPGKQQPQPTGPSVSKNGLPNVESPVAPADPTADATATTADPTVPVAETLVDPNAVTTPPTEEEVKAVTELLAQPAEGANDVPAAAATDAAPQTGTAVTETVLTEEDTRSSTEDFATTASGKKKDKKKKDKDSGLSDFEKAGLVALGALAVGAMLSNRDQVVSNTGDRVVVQRSDGNYAVYKDDDALLRQPGSAVKTETFKDGSTRTTVTRDDGTSVVTIRDATGRVLKRTAYDTKGREIVLIDDLAPETPVVVSKLPKPAAPSISTQGGDPELAAALAAIQARELGRTFSLRQVRDIKEVRALAATVDVDNITFDTGSAAITVAQAENLAALGSFLKKMLARNPGEIFLVEGHTDAVGSAAANLALSDRRAESVALALTEYFGVPPENLVVQGYGESDLRVPTDGDERRNRRVAVRVITPLLTMAQN